MEQGYLSVCPSVRPRVLQKKVCLLPFVDFYHYRIIIVFFDTLQSERTIHVFILIHTLSLTLILKNATTTPLGKSLQHWNGWSFDFTFSQVTSEWMTLICLVIPSVLVSYKSLGSSGRVWICLQFNYSLIPADSTSSSSLCLSISIVWFIYYEVMWLEVKYYLHTHSHSITPYPLVYAICCCIAQWEIISLHCGSHTHVSLILRQYFSFTFYIQTIIIYAQEYSKFLILNRGLRRSVVCAVD